MTNGQMDKLGATDTQTQKFLFCVSWQQNVGHTELDSTDAVSVAPIWWEWLGFYVRFKLGGSDIEMLVTPNLCMWNLTEWICGKND